MKKQKLHKNHRSGFKTPVNYFGSFEDTLFAKIETNNFSNQMHASGYTTPSNYFEDLESQVVSQSLKKQPKVISIFKNRWTISSVAAAASITLILFLFYNKQDELSFNNLEMAAIENYILNSDVNANDISQFLNDEDFNNSLSDHSTLTEDNLENYLLNNTNLEDLLID
jgi:hypothetical protein